MNRTREQMRVSALGAARYTLKCQKVKPLVASSSQALEALASYAGRYRNMEGSQWYHTATQEELIQFCRCWREWQRRMNTLKQLPDCRLFTRNSAVWATVYQLSTGVEGFVMIADEEVPVYVIDGSKQTAWTTMKQEAGYYAARLYGVRQ